MFGQRQQFDIIVAMLFAIWNQGLGQFAICKPTAIVMPTPRAGMELINIDWFIVVIAACGPPRAVRKLVFSGLCNDRSCVGPQLRVVGVGVGL